MKRCLAPFLPLAGLLLAAAPCPPSPDTPDAVALSHVAAAIRPDRTLAILDVGSGGELAHAGHKPGAGVPGGIATQMLHALQASLHGLHATLTLRGGRGLTAVELAAMIRAELARSHYQLVLWQTGTVDAVDEVSPDDFSQALADTAAAITGAGADLVLIEPQYSRFLEENANLEPYLSAMQSIGALPGVAVFPRYALMRGWADAGAIDLERTPRADRPVAAARLHLCLGRELARRLLADIAAASPD